MGFYLGSAKEKITPPKELLPRLYGLMRSRFAGVIDDLHVRVMIIRNDEGSGQNAVMFVSWELDKAPIPEEILPLLSAKTDIAQDHILYFSVHTHTAPLHSARPGDGPNGKAKQDPDTQQATNEYEEILKEAVLKAAYQALSSMQSVKIGWSVGKSYVGEHRIQDYYVEKDDGSIEKTSAVGSNPTKDICRDLFIMRADDLNGDPVCFFVNHAVHSCVMILNNFDGKGGVGISADLGGQVSCLLEEKYPGCVALWSSGAAGDINPVMLNQYNTADPVNGAPVEFRGYSSAEPASLMLMMMSRRQLADALAANRNITTYMNSDTIAAGNVMAECFCTGEEEPYRVRLQGARIGDIAFCGASGELFDSLGRTIKRAAGEKFGSVVVINHECSMLVDSGYIIDDEGFARCTRADGKMGGIPGIGQTRLRPGYIDAALKEKAAELFEMLG